MLMLTLLAEGSEFSPDVFDQPWWMLLAYAVVRLVKRKEPKLWVYAGLVGTCPRVRLKRQRQRDAGIVADARGALASSKADTRRMKLHPLLEWGGRDRERTGLLVRGRASAGAN